MSFISGGTAPAFEPGPQDTQDKRASAEAVAFGAGSDLQKEKAIKEDVRFQAFRNHLNTGLIGILWIVIVLLGIGILAFAWHILTPTCWHFLEDKALSKLETILATALLSSALSAYASKQMS